MWSERCISRKCGRSKRPVTNNGEGGGGGYKMGGGLQVKLYPYKREGAEKVFAILNGSTKSCGVVFVQ